ncbi:hypothetical protein Patl1_26386 [Pistacia atlantica]|uniref:Uncharacterized protein n=1 Tax=Pistacia atlantica TaxID=434234 RepID=A0ACC1AZD4_9ROSI|nr:hypothetical protein Patl1_26386 [Pistacia atlantica]
MAEETKRFYILATLLKTILISYSLIPIVLCEPEILPADSSKLDAWIGQNVKQFVETKSLDDEKGSILDDVLATAEAGLKVITQERWGSKRHAKDCVRWNKTKYGTVDSATVGVSDYFVAINIAFVNTTIKSVAKGLSVITAHGREEVSGKSGFAFVHCNIIGTGDTYLGRAWKNSPRVIFAYTYMGEHINDQGWLSGMYQESNSNQKEVYYGEYKCMGPGADSTGRAKFSKTLSDAEAEPFLSMTYLDGNKWVLPPPKV